MSTTGVVTTFSIVAQAPPGVRVPFAPAVIDCDGTPVRGNLVNVPLDPEHIALGMPVRLVTYSLGLDDNGNEAVAFGFEPVEPDTSNTRPGGAPQEDQDE